MSEMGFEACNENREQGSLWKARNFVEKMLKISLICRDRRCLLEVGEGTKVVFKMVWIEPLVNLRHKFIPRVKDNVVAYPSEPLQYCSFHEKANQMKTIGRSRGVEFEVLLYMEYPSVGVGAVEFGGIKAEVGSAKSISIMCFG